ncbi:MAG TPA: hypothetical protein VF058_07480, partial [Actinomycetota bacterium]
LRDWTYKVKPPPELEWGAEPEPPEGEEDVAPTSVTPTAQPGEAAPEETAPTVAPERAAEAPPERAAEAPPEQAAPADAPQAPAAPEQAAPAARQEVEPDQATYDRVLQEQLDAGVNPRVAEGRAKAAAIRAARQGGVG